jgi:hypothetical protein
MGEAMEKMYKNMNSEREVLVSALLTKCALQNQIIVAWENAVDWSPELGWFIAKPHLLDEAYKLQEMGLKNGIL